MTHRILVSLAAATLAACSQSNDAPQTAAQPATAATPAPGATAATGSDPCALVANPEAVLGQPVTASHYSNVNGSVDCHWKSAEGLLCGSLTMFGPGYNETGSARINYEGMTKSMGAFGQTWDVSGVGDEAKAVDGGILGAQLAFRKGDHAVLVASGCKSGADGAPALAERLAREVAGRL